MRLFFKFRYLWLGMDPYFSRSRLSSVLGVVVVSILLASCNNGGSGSVSDTGSLRISVEPKTISPGSLAFLEVSFRDSGYDDLETNGLTLKLLIPNQIGFITGSASLTRSSGAVAIAPIYYGEAPRELVQAVLVQTGVEPPTDAAAADEFSFLIFSLPPALIESGDSGDIHLSLNVAGTPKVSKIFGDLDRVAVTNFSATAPDFDVETEQEIEIIDPTLTESNQEPPRIILRSQPPRIRENIRD